ncbi:hypothetical protein GF314_00420 [bacterium]|nr:hypothetical protein [bacterium]
MPRKGIGGGLVLVGLVVAVGGAVEVPLPGLAGEYEMLDGLEPDFGYPSTRTVAFTIPDGVTAIDQLHLVVSGEWAAGEIGCSGVGGDE